MSSDDKKKSEISQLITSALGLEFHSDAGKYNVTFTLALFVVALAYALGEYIQIFVYAFKFNEKYKTLTLFQTLKIPLICGAICFAYMIFIADKKEKVQKEIISKTKPVPKEYIKKQPSIKNHSVSK